MAERNIQNLSGVEGTLLVPLYVRAMESQRPDALLKDEKALGVVAQMGGDFSWLRRAQVSEETQLALLLRNREFDRWTRAFLTQHPEAVVVHIGCGLDARFERVDNGQVEWYDLDLPEVIELRRKLIGDEGARHNFLACSVLDRAWLNTVRAHHQRPFLFLAEGVLMFFEEAQVKSLVLTLREHFPGAELIFDAFSPFFVWANNRRVARTKIGAQCHWSLKRGQDLESWGDGIRLIAEWFPFGHPEPRLAYLQWARFIPLLAKVIGVFHYRLGESALSGASR